MNKHQYRAIVQAQKAAPTVRQIDTLAYQLPLPQLLPLPKGVF